MKYLAAVSVIALSVAVPAASAQNGAGEGSSSGRGEGQQAIAARGARLPGFAADLAQQASITGPSAWKDMSGRLAWDGLVSAPRDRLQAARWAYARSLIGSESGPEAFGVLELMAQDDPDLAMVESFRLARGAALTLLGRHEDAVSELVSGTLARNPEACAWRMRALAEGGFDEQAAQEVGCASPALKSGRPRGFVLAASHALLETGHFDRVPALLSALPDRDPAANLLRGKAQAAQQQFDAARLSFARAELSGTEIQRVDARLSQIEAGLAAHTIDRKAALREVDALRYGWRGGDIEERALRLSYRLHSDAGELAAALDSGAALFRHFDVVSQGPEFLPDLRKTLENALDAGNKLPLEKAAGLYWDYRDLAPSGEAGDRLAFQLADRLQAAGLYERAADLLNYQLFTRAGDLARGPLSARVGSLYVLSGRPGRALDILAKSEDSAFPADMVGLRKRVEAVALSQLGRIDEAMATLDGVPASTPLQAEILWRQRNWARYAEASGAGLPASGKLDTVAQAVVLRHAIALAMLGREDRLAQLHGRYGAAFASLPTAPVFEMLTGQPTPLAPGLLGKAMAALPSVNPAGDIGDLLDRAPRVEPSRP